MNLTATTKDKETPSASLVPDVEQSCRCFSFAELISATNNFEEKLCIGRGGFGRVYKGMILDGTTNRTYAIKRLNSLSDQGAPEFWVEVEMLSRLRHCNLVCLIGYCNDGKEMALVYEYMHNGTLSDHLHKKGTPLTWSQRLKICLGAARGLDYLHTGTGTKHGVTHRDVKTSNILLDQNFAAKIADFGLAKIGPINQALTYISTGVKGTFGYMDPSYFYTGRLTRKSDVYAFGVVLLEVLCGRPALDESLDEGLAVWAQDRIKQGKVSQIIDPNLKDHISRSSLKEFSRIAARCVLSHPNQRPTMSEVVGCLDLALSIQKRKDFSPQRGIITRKLWSIISRKGYFEFNSRVATLTPESKGTNGEIVSIPVPTLVTDPPEGQDANYDPLPAIHGFQIFGDAFPGGELSAAGYCINGTYLGVDAVPLDENGRMGNLFTCFANKGLLITRRSQ
ncbi:serine/threonine/dual specificity protein kinase, catalytic domain-containing protein [Artemisia annua]|uniref:non-specific serine/threonine protein kinase n=1 Tax=Artemisia annua TaxID=35608 RepID=A0A2U1Q406_ARTAN|nr:serine/threonine/dual specificity protein kinase, catalytic domain-containing protein [Artemisia annua]